jgi:FkbM family methyltransferase
MTKYILFDVGAHRGQDSVGRAAGNAGVEVYAFEPTPASYDNIAGQISGFSDRYHLVQMAVSDYDGTAEFNIQTHPDQACNSLYKFDTDNIKNSLKGWNDEDRSHAFVMSHTIEVKVTRLDTWIKNNAPDLTHIDYFHCDVQGNDLKVLQGLGEYIHLIKEGKVECPREHETRLYTETHTLDETVKFLESKGFEIKEVEANDPWNYECNIHFKKREHE